MSVSNSGTTRAKAKELKDLTNLVENQSPTVDAAQSKDSPITSQSTVPADLGLSISASCEPGTSKFSNQCSVPPTALRTESTKSSSHRTSSLRTSRSTSNHRFSVSSHLSAKTRSAILRAKIQSEAQINEIQKRQNAEHHIFESNVMKRTTRAGTNIKFLSRKASKSLSIQTLPG